MGIWFFLVAFILGFLIPGETALGQIYWKAKEDGSMSFSDNPTSSVLKEEFDEKTWIRAEIKQDFVKYSLPNKNWAVEFPLKGFKIQESEVLRDFESIRIQAQTDRTNLIFSFSIIPATRALDSRGLRDSNWNRLKKLPFKRESVKKYEAGDWAFLEYLVKDVEDLKGLNQKNVFAYLVKGDTWVNYHLSKASYKPSDEKLFKDFIKSVKILQPFSPSSVDHFFFGSHYYYSKKFMKAILHFEKALVEEKQNPRLEKNLGRVLIDNLGMAYGLTGNLEMSKKTFEYGISIDPTFPMYYYNLACTYAEINHLEKAVENLHLAARYKNNMIPGERPPDALKDSSFKRFVNDKKFIEAAKAFR
jgi:tetratricopeptide (TPR) repeat protein